MLPLASHALWHQFHSRSMAKNHAQIGRGLEGVEVIADDFIIAGFGNTTEEAYESLECNE